MMLLNSHKLICHYLTGDMEDEGVRRIGDRWLHEGRGI